MASEFQNALALADEAASGRFARCDIVMRFLRSHACASASLGGGVDSVEVIEIAGYDPVKNEIVYAGPSPPSPWSPVHWLALRVCPGQNTLLHVYDSASGANRFPVDGLGIERLAEPMKGLQSDGFMHIPVLGVIAQGRTAEEAAARLRLAMEQSEEEQK